MTQAVKQPGPKVAIVGAGISGLACARKLYDAGMQVTVFEKSRGLGGRMATRRTLVEQTFDHGAQYFAVRDSHFETHVSGWLQEGVVAPWHGRICKLKNGVVDATDQTTKRYVGVPGMNAICHSLAAGVDLRLKTHIAPVERNGEQWQLSDKHGQSQGHYDVVLITAPAPQTALLLAAIPDLQQQVQVVPMHGCWATMLSFERSLNLPYEGAFVEQSLLSWIACNSSKPFRNPPPETWVLHASAQWTSEHIEENPTDVLKLMQDAFWQATGATKQAILFSEIHRWRYAIPPEPLECKAIYDSQYQVGACGDWCSGPRVESAFLSGTHLADQVLASFTG